MWCRNKQQIADDLLLSPHPHLSPTVSTCWLSLFRWKPKVIDLLAHLIYLTRATDDRQIDDDAHFGLAVPNHHTIWLPHGHPWYKFQPSHFELCRAANNLFCIQISKSFKLGICQCAIKWGGQKLARGHENLQGIAEVRNETKISPHLRLLM